MGEDLLSYGYGGTAKTSVNCKFGNYGVKYSVGDIVGCYLVRIRATFAIYTSFLKHFLV